ncbi:MAG: hypothetical protein QM820_19125 [Minicystis sp.]
MRSTRRTAVALAIGAGLWASSPATARASDTEVAVAVVMVAGAAADLGFTGYDLYVAGKRRLPARGAAIAEIAVTAPQAILYTAAGSVLLAEQHHDDPSTVLALLPLMWIDALAVHGIWATATDRVRPDLLPALSLMIGANTALSSLALTHALKGRLLRRPFGIAAMVLTAPQLAVSIPAAIKSDRDRAGWIGAASWSGALFVHGLVSTILARPEPEPQPPIPPPPPVPEKPPLLVPASLRVTPTVIHGDLGSAPGIMVTGMLF